jgi:hypothetical protein
MKVLTTARRQSSRLRMNNRVEWAIRRHVARHPTATPIATLLSAVREIRAQGFQVTMSLKINGRTIR